MQQQASGQERRYKSRSANRKKKRKIPQIDNSEGIQTKIISHRCGGTGVAVMMVNSRRRDAGRSRSANEGALRESAHHTLSRPTHSELAQGLSHHCP